IAIRTLCCVILPLILPRSRGSSIGQTRIIRKAYEHDFYTHMMEECYLLWAKLEAEANVTLFRYRTGILLKGPDDVDFQQFKSILEKNQVPTETLGPEEFIQRLPQVNLLAGEGTLIDTTAGVLYANRALRAVQRVFQSEGGVIKDGYQVTDIQPGSTVPVMTATEVYRAESQVITAGPWDNTLMNWEISDFIEFKTNGNPEKKLTPTGKILLERSSNS
uniref:FAD dependent oxidoreductase domain-containing protein n=1 Tax=Oncorhynchus tshawytscha TaxID=74940 RepID=A0AAZ3SK64_ONCTS